MRAVALISFPISIFAIPRCRWEYTEDKSGTYRVDIDLRGLQFTPLVKTAVQSVAPLLTKKTEEAPKLKSCERHQQSNISRVSVLMEPST